MKGRRRSPANYSVFSKWHRRPLLRAELVAWKRRIENEFFFGRPAVPHSVLLNVINIY